MGEKLRDCAPTSRFGEQADVAPQELYRSVNSLRRRFVYRVFTGRGSAIPYPGERLNDENRAQSLSRTIFPGTAGTFPGSPCRRAVAIATRFTRAGDGDQGQSEDYGLQAHVEVACACSMRTFSTGLSILALHDDVDFPAEMH